MPNDKEKQLREMYKELATLAKDSIERDKQLAKLEAEVKAMRDAMPRWISVDDRLPQADRKPESGMSHDMIVLCEHGFVNIGWCQIDSGRWYSDVVRGGRLEGVTHWMPLPEPPTGGVTGGATGGEQIPYVAIGNGEPVPEHLQHLFVRGEKRDVDEFTDEKTTER